MESQDAPERLRKLGRLPARLVFDTADYPLPAGVRRRDESSRHLLYEAGELCLDLRLEHDPESSRTALVGQLADSGDPLRAQAAVPVFVVSGEEVLAQTISNSMGEFQLDYPPRPAPALCLPVGDEQLIEVPLVASVGDEPDTEG